jgi:hypothetical protein
MWLNWHYGKTLSLLATPNKIFMPVSDAVFILHIYPGISLEGWDLLVRTFSL